MGKTPEVSYTSSGQAVAKFSIATDATHKNKDGETVKKADWHNIVAWGKQAETIAQYVHKGDQIVVQGRLRTRDYEAKDGSGKRYITEITIFSFDFGAKGKGQDDDHYSSPASGDKAEATATNDQPSDDDIPF